MTVCTARIQANMSTSFCGGNARENGAAAGWNGGRSAANRAGTRFASGSLDKTPGFQGISR